MPTRRFVPPLALVLLAQLSCAAPPPTAAPAPIVARPPTPAPARATATALPTPPPIAAAPALPALDLHLSVAAEGLAPRDLALHPLRGALVFQAGARVARLAGDRLLLDAALTRGVPAGMTAMSFFGSFPDAMWAQFRDEAASGNDSYFGALYRFRKDRFKLVGKTGANLTYDGPWYSGDGRVGAISFAHLDDQNQTWVQLLDGPKGAAIPKPAALKNGGARLGFHHSLALPTGQLVTLGLDISSPTEPSVIERWEAGRAESVVEPLPCPPGSRVEATALFGRSATEIYVGGEVIDRASSALYLARFDGATWSQLEVPSPALGQGRPVFAVGDDGAVWMLRAIGEARLGLFRRGSDGAWTTLALPASAGTEARQLVVLGTSDLWILAVTGGWAGVAGETGPPLRFVVSRSMAVAEVLRL